VCLPQEPTAEQLGTIAKFFCEVHVTFINEFGGRYWDRISNEHHFLFSPLTLK
jgi:hypothetical protein